MRRLLVVAALAPLAACGDSAAALGPPGLDLPAAAAAQPLATGTMYTSPDGGIYRNPVRLEVLMLVRRDVSGLAAQLGGAAAGWAQLRHFGGFTLLAVRLTNRGKAWSEPDLSDLQIASDYAPAGTATGPLRHWYHPTYTMAAVADRPISAQCQPHIDPGQSTTALLVYPPVSATTSILWGRYQDFALRIPFGGGAGSLLAAHLHAAICPAPVPPPP